MPPIRFHVNFEATPVNSGNYHDANTDFLHVELAYSTRLHFEAKSDTGLEHCRKRHQIRNCYGPV